MLIYALDDEPLLLDALKAAIAEAAPDAEIHTFPRAKLALAEMEEEKLCPDVAFLDIEMPGMSGLELAKCIKDRSPNTNIVFVTGFSQYALEVYSLRPSGYVMKPATAEKIRSELDDLRRPIARKSAKRIRVQCFGNFEVFVGGKPVKFKYNKTKELFAYLIDRCGASMSTAEISAVLWEDAESTFSQKSQFRNLVSDLSKTLQSHGITDVFVKSRNSFSVNTQSVDCDMYRFLQNDVAAVNAYRSEYMAQYSWAEMMTGRLSGMTR